jgi:hypothetical protein
VAVTLDVERKLMLYMETIAEGRIYVISLPKSLIGVVILHNGDRRKLTLGEWFDYLNR